MTLDEMLCRVTTARPLGTVDFHAYRLAHPELDRKIQGLSIGTMAGLMAGAVSLDGVFGAVFAWCVDAIYNFGPPDDLRIMPLQEDPDDHAR